MRQWSHKKQSEGNIETKDESGSSSELGDCDRGKLRCMCVRVCGCVGGRRRSCQPTTLATSLAPAANSVNHRGRIRRRHLPKLQTCTRHSAWWAQATSIWWTAQLLLGHCVCIHGDKEAQKLMCSVVTVWTKSEMYL